MPPGFPLPGHEVPPGAPKADAPTLGGNGYPPAVRPAPESDGRESQPAAQVAPVCSADRGKNNCRQDQGETPASEPVRRQQGLSPAVIAALQDEDQQNHGQVGANATENPSRVRTVRIDKVGPDKHNPGKGRYNKRTGAMENLPPDALDYIASHHFTRDRAMDGVRDEIFAVVAALASAAGLTWIGAVEYIWSFLGVILLFYGVVQFF